jgi:NADPH:quinone reductase-like Zn-dependent oxidoreductase
LLIGPLIAMARKKKMRLVVLKPNKDLAYLSELFEAGKVKPVLDQRRTLNELPEAMRHFGTGNHQGKVVITLE